MVERALIMSRGGMLDAGELSSGPAGTLPAESVGGATLEEVERAHILRMLDGAGWTIEGDRGAARILGLNPSTLRGRMRKLGIRKTR